MTGIKMGVQVDLQEVLSYCHPFRAVTIKELLYRQWLLLMLRLKPITEDRVDMGSDL